MYIATKINPTQSRERSYIYISRDHSVFFPDPYEKFRIIDFETNEEHSVHLENSNRIPKLGKFFRSHPEIKEGTKLLIKIVEDNKIYKIYVDKQPTDPELIFEEKVEEIISKSGKNLFENYKLEEEVLPKNTVSQVIRKVRDTEKSMALKKMYDFKCQICQKRIQISPDKYYAEGHHIKPLSKNGSDTFNNIIVLCPNHHVEFERGIISIDPINKKTLLHIYENIEVHGKELFILDGHKLKKENLVFHFENNYKFNIENK